MIREIRNQWMVIATYLLMCPVRDVAKHQMMVISIKTRRMLPCGHSASSLPLSPSLQLSTLCTEWLSLPVAYCNTRQNNVVDRYRRVSITKLSSGSQIQSGCAALLLLAGWSARRPSHCRHYEVKAAAETGLMGSQTKLQSHTSNNYNNLMTCWRSQSWAPLCDFLVRKCKSCCLFSSGSDCIAIKCW